MSFDDQNWLRRFRSSSCSSDLDVDDSNLSKTVDPKLISSQHVSAICKSETYSRSLTDNLSSNDKQLYANQFAASLSSGHELLSSQPCTFPFTSLTDECKLYIFGKLNPAERGIASCVCREWSVLMHSPVLWNVIDLVAFPEYPGVTVATDDILASDECLKVYEKYRARLKRYIAFLINVRPQIKKIRFELDIGDVRDGWLDVIQGLFHASQLQNLKHAELGWTETPAKPYVPDNSSATWCANDCKDFMYRHRHRQRLFVKFFDLFTAVAQSVVSLTLPFDWTERSLHALHRLSNIEVLNLQKYFVFQALDQSLINSLFRSAPFLRRLTMEIWTPSGRGLQKFSLYSDSLEFLDVSRCRGFYIDELALPLLEEFHVNVCPMNGPLVSGEDVDVKCMFAVLQSGAPNLRHINYHHLRVDWCTSPYDELDILLKSVCACAAHQCE